MVSLPRCRHAVRAPAMRIVASASTVFSVAAFVLALATAATVAIDRWRGDGDVVRGSGYGLASPENRRQRVMFPVQEPPGAPHANTMVSLSQNWGWAQDGGWKRDDPAQPSVALTVESWFRGLAELNFDMEPPQGPAQGGARAGEARGEAQGETTPIGAWPGGRAMGLAARYDGSFAI